tara:strand:- start:1374 stop:2423 length:1050 start_codon:yes stop_codon:yes gene_type:complete
MVASQNPSPYKCGACGLIGHNRRTCVAKPPGTPALDYRIGKEVKCGACGKRGHNKRTCPERPRIHNWIKCGACGLDGHNRRTCPSGCPEEGIPPPRTEWTPKHPPNTFTIFGTFGDFWCDEEYCTVGSDIDDELPLSILQKPLVPPNEAMPLSLLMSVMDFGVRENVRKSPHSPCLAEIRALGDDGALLQLNHLIYDLEGGGSYEGINHRWCYNNGGEWEGALPDLYTEDRDEMVAWNRLSTIVTMIARDRGTEYFPSVAMMFHWKFEDNNGNMRKLADVWDDEMEYDRDDVIRNWKIETYIAHLIENVYAVDGGTILTQEATEACYEDLPMCSEPCGICYLKDDGRHE